MRSRLLYQYWERISIFMEVAKDHFNSNGCVSCPCQKCLNHVLLPLETVISVLAGNICFHGGYINALLNFFKFPKGSDE